MGTCRNDIRLSHYKQVREKEEAKTVSNNDFIKMTHAKKNKKKSSSPSYNKYNYMDLLMVFIALLAQYIIILL